MNFKVPFLQTLFLSLQNYYVITHFTQEAISLRESLIPQKKLNLFFFLKYSLNLLNFFPDLFSLLTHSALTSWTEGVLL